MRPRVTALRTVGPLPLVLTGCVLAVAACTAPTTTAVPAVTVVHPPGSAPVTGATAVPSNAPGNDQARQVAASWLRAYRSSNWTDARPGAWVDRVAPWVTETLNAADQQYRDADGGADWTQFVAGQCHDTVTDVSAVIPREAPGGQDSTNVDVTGTVVTSCDATAADSQQTASTTLLVVRISGGWKVDQRVH